jgi:phosphoribosylanthranilate isomerase
MNPTVNVRVKICCIGSLEEARLAISNGASAIGLVSAMPSGPGPIPEELIASIAANVPPSVATFLLTCKQDASAIIEQHCETKTNTIQIVDEFPRTEYGILRKELPGVKLVQVVHVQDENSIKRAVEVSEYVDAILLDSGNPNLAKKELGGTGRVHDWSISKKVRETVNIPIFLAGGLNSENVTQAIEIVRPFAVDVCSGVRTNERLEEKKLSAFFDAVERTRRRRSIQ